MTDKLLKTDTYTLQHGKENNRIYLMKLDQDDYLNTIEFINNLACNKGYTKIIAKIPQSLKIHFIKNGYIMEAFVKDFYYGEEDCCFMSKYLSEGRKEVQDKEQGYNVRKLCHMKPYFEPKDLKKKYSIKFLDKDYTSLITDIYIKTFSTYPFPIFENNYIQKTMDEGVEYIGIFDKKNLVGICSAEIDYELKNAEMTDFAVLDEHRGNNISYFLLQNLENKLMTKDIKTFYTIARSGNVGINLAFVKNGYSFGGELLNNTNICGAIESMNIWYKNISC